MAYSEELWAEAKRLSYAEIKALCAGNPLIAEKTSSTQAPISRGNVNRPVSAQKR